MHSLSYDFINDIWYLLTQNKDEQWKRAMEYVSLVSELNYMTQVVIMLYEDPTKDVSSDERFHVELHFSPGVNCCVQKELPPGPGFRPHSRSHCEGSEQVGDGMMQSKEIKAFGEYKRQVWSSLINWAIMD